MTKTEAETRVRHLLNQTDSSNTLYDNTNFIDHALNEGRRLFATILDERYLIRLRKSASLTVAAGVGTYPTDFLKIVKDPYVVIDTEVATRIPDNERWRLRFLSNAESAAPSVANDVYYYYEDSSGVKALPSSAAAITYEYIKTPGDLDANENYELPDSVNDLTVEYAFEKCTGTTRGDKELAVYLANKQKLKIDGMQSGL